MRGDDWDDSTIDSQHVLPGTGHLKGTKDNFNDDPAISIDQMQDKLRETKEKISHGAERLLESAKQATKQTTESVAQTGQNLKEAARDVAESAKNSAQNAKVKIKETLTGEREKEKPDETKSEVRTKAGSWSPGEKKRGSSWQ